MGEARDRFASATLERVRSRGASLDEASLVAASRGSDPAGAASRALMGALARLWSASPDTAISARRRAELSTGLRFGYAAAARVLGAEPPDTMLEAELLKTRLRDLPVPDVVAAAGAAVRTFATDSAVAAAVSAKRAGSGRDRTIEAHITGFWAGFVIALAERGGPVDV